MWELDHVFVMTPRGGDRGEELASRGFVESGRREHVGQGTANRCFMFRNAYLELLYPTDEAALGSPLVRPTRLLERARWRESGVSPFGVCLRGQGGQGEPPVPTWAYRPPYLPPGGSIPIAEDAAGGPLLFFSSRPGPPAVAQVNPWRLARVRIESPALPPWVEVMRSTAPFVEVTRAAGHSMTIELEDGTLAAVLSLDCVM